MARLALALLFLAGCGPAFTAAIDGPEGGDPPAQAAPLGQGEATTAQEPPAPPAPPPAPGQVQEAGPTPVPPGPEAAAPEADRNPGFGPGLDAGEGKPDVVSTSPSGTQEAGSPDACHGLLQLVLTEAGLAYVCD